MMSGQVSEQLQKLQLLVEAYVDYLFFGPTSHSLSAENCIAGCYMLSTKLTARIAIDSHLLLYFSCTTWSSLIQVR